MRMNLIALIAAVLPVVVCVSDEPTRKGTAPATSAQFQDETYRLAWVNEASSANHGEIVNEYVRPNETLENWTRLIAVRYFPQRRDYQHMAGNLVQALKQQNPMAPYAIMESPDGTRTMVDFVTWDLNANITEFNVFLYQLGADGKSVIAQQFAMRAYGKEEGFEFLRKLKELRPELLKAAIQYEFPAITARQPE